MTNSHIPTRPNFTATYATDIFPKCTVVDGGFLSCHLKECSTSELLVTGNVLQRAHLWN